MKKLALLIFFMLFLVSFTQAQKHKSKMTYIEIAKFKLKEGFTDEQFIEAEKNVRNGLIKSQKGFISCETGVDADGTWVIVVHWETLADSEASMQKWATEASVDDFKEMIEPTSFRMGVYDSKAFLKN